MKVEEMKLIEEGKNEEIVLKKIGVKRRMNVGKIMEKKIGWD